MFNWLRKLFYKEAKDQIKVRFELDDGKYYEELIDAENFQSRITELQSQLNPTKPFEEIDFIWCLVGNIIDKHSYGQNLELRHGTKHFSPGTKVYCFPILWGDGYEKIKVIGRHRKTKKFITIITESKYITNWRLQSVYSPHIVKTMVENEGWSGKQKDKETILKMLKWLPEKTKASF